MFIDGNYRPDSRRAKISKAPCYHQVCLVGKTRKIKGKLQSNVMGAVRTGQGQGDMERHVMSTGGGGLERNAGEGVGHEIPQALNGISPNRRGSGQPASGFPWSTCGQQPG